MTYVELVDRFKKYWFCQPAYSGNGGPCQPSAAHQASYGCGWRWWASVTDADFTRFYKESGALEELTNRSPNPTNGP